MIDQKIAFIVCTNDEQYMRECRYYIERLYIPTGYTIETIEIKNAVSMTSAYNEGMKQTSAKYKIYLHQDVFLINRRMLVEMLSIFENRKIGMLGVFGGNFQANADFHQYWNKGHTLDAVYSGMIDFDFYTPESGDILKVDAIDGMFIATQYDILWDERITGWHMYDVSQAIRFQENGYEVCVLNKKRTWTLHDAGFCSERGYDEAREQIAKYYPKYFTYQPIERKLNTDDMDTICKKEIYDEIKEKEVEKYGFSKIPEEISDFWNLYCEVKFYLFRMIFGMPKDDWKTLLDYILTKKISTAFLMIALSICTKEPDIAAQMIEKELTNVDTTVLFFDQYQRYHTIAELIRRCKKGLGISSCSILEVGANAHKNLEKELYEDEILYTDLSIPKEYIYDNRYFAADACHMPQILDCAFDFCVAADVFEHIPYNRRKDFLKELYRVCKKSVIICFPYDEPEVVEAEEQVNCFYQRNMGVGGNPWLLEHEECGLPNREDVEKFLQEEKISFKTFTHGEISLWEKLTTINALIDSDKWNEAISELNIYYNRYIYAYDRGECDYRVFFVLEKEASVDLKDLFQTNETADKTFADSIYNTLCAL